jgi:hypothetical protein
MIVQDETVRRQKAEADFVKLLADMEQEEDQGSTVAR